MDMLTRFWAKASPRGTGCWEWTAARNNRGYGVFQLGRNKQESAHRMAWMLANSSDIPKKGFICHVRDNPGCVNPGHLYLGDALSNMRDKFHKGRANSRGPVGEAHASAKLREIDVRDIRRMYASGTVTMRALASKYGVHHSQVVRAVSGVNWGHVT